MSQVLITGIRKIMVFQSKEGDTRIITEVPEK